MGRRKIDIEPLTNERNRSVTFLKRRTGLFKKAYELAVLCSVDIALVIFDRKPNHSGSKLYQFSSSNIDEILSRHARHKGDKESRTIADYSGSHDLQTDELGEDEDETVLEEDLDPSPPATSSTSSYPQQDQLRLSRKRWNEDSALLPADDPNNGGKTIGNSYPQRTVGLPVAHLNAFQRPCHPSKRARVEHHYSDSPGHHRRHVTHLPYPHLYDAPPRSLFLPHGGGENIHRGMNEADPSLSAEEYSLAAAAAEVALWDVPSTQVATTTTLQLTTAQHQQQQQQPQIPLHLQALAHPRSHFQPSTAPSTVEPSLAEDPAASRELPSEFYTQIVAAFAEMNERGSGWGSLPDLTLGSEPFGSGSAGGMSPGLDWPVHTTGAMPRSSDDNLAASWLEFLSRPSTGPATGDSSFGVPPVSVPVSVPVPVPPMVPPVGPALGHPGEADMGGEGTRLQAENRGESESGAEERNTNSQQQQQNNSKPNARKDRRFGPDADTSPDAGVDEARRHADDLTTTPALLTTSSSARKRKPRAMRGKPASGRGVRGSNLHSAAVGMDGGVRDGGEEDTVKGSPPTPPRDE